MKIENKNKIYIEHLLEVIEKLPLEEKITAKLSKNAYLTRANDPEANIYVLVQGMIISSLVGTDGERINLAYMNSPDIISLLRGEDEKVVEQPYDIRVDSQIATFYQINRVKFWQIVNNDPLLSQYVRIYYRKTINKNTHQMRQYIGNSKSGQVYSFLYECTKIFGVQNMCTGNILINHRITHQTIGEFCGIRNRSSVTRIMNKLAKADVIEQQLGFIKVKDRAYLEKYAKRI